MRIPFGPYIICQHLAIFQFIFYMLTLNTVLAGPRYSSRIVETKSGPIRGVILELNSKHLEPVEVFKSVPYANAPVGNLRFAPPTPVTPWKETKLADSFSPVCPQNFPDIANKTAALMYIPKGRYQFLKKLLPLLVNQSEDCLTINIYVPGSGNRGLEAPYSVFFYVHGESFEWGSGNPYDGSVLASYGHVIVVTVNYRLGILGFIKTRASTTSAGSGGNLGLMDILAALEWIKQNIAAFGGDPSRVNIVGHDTGAALANLILISKVGKGLINRAILLSGSALSPWSIIPDPDSIREEISQQMACHLDINGNNKLNKDVTNDITNCLRSKPLEALMGIKLPNVRFMPTWGPFLPLDDAPDAEFAMEHSGQGFVTKELMIGMSTTESYNDFSASDIQYGLEEEQRNRLLRTYIRNAFTFHLNEIFSAVRNEYTDWDKPIQHPINIRDSTMEALSDGHTVSPLIKVGYLHARRGAKTYLFHFGYQTKDSDYPQRLGSVRGEDLPYVFGLPLVLGMPNFSQNYSRQDMGVAEAMLNFITNFCKTGDPNESGQPQQTISQTDYGTTRERTRYRGITWDTYETTTQQYLSVSLKPKMKSHYRGHKMAVWLNLIPQLHRPGETEVSMRHHHFRERESHYYAGNVRAESFVRPNQFYQNGQINGVQESRQENYGPECTPDPTMGESLMDDTEESINLELDEDELFRKLATRQYYSYTAALGVTVGVGCLLLVLNMLIFAGIYYQRERSRRKNRNNTQSSNNSAVLNSVVGHDSSNDGDIPLTVRPTTSPGKTKPEPPPSYTTLQRSPCPHRDKSKLNETNCETYKQQTLHVPELEDQQAKYHHAHHHSSNSGTLCSNKQNRNSSINKVHKPPQPPQRTSSNPISDNNSIHQIDNQTEHQPQQVFHPHHHHYHHHHLQQQQQQQQHQETSQYQCHQDEYDEQQSHQQHHLLQHQQKLQQQQHNQPQIYNTNNSNSNSNSNTSTLKKRVQIQEVTV